MGITFIVNGLEIYPHPETLRIVIPITNDLMRVINCWQPPESGATLNKIKTYTLYQLRGCKHSH